MFTNYGRILTRVDFEEMFLQLQPHKASHHVVGSINSGQFKYIPEQGAKPKDMEWEFMPEDGADTIQPRSKLYSLSLLQTLFTYIQKITPGLTVHHWKHFLQAPVPGQRNWVTTMQNSLDFAWRNQISFFANFGAIEHVLKDLAFVADSLSTLFESSPSMEAKKLTHASGTPYYLTKTEMAHSTENNLNPTHHKNVYLTDRTQKGFATVADGRLHFEQQKS